MDYKNTEVRPSTSSAVAAPLARSLSIYSLTFDELQTTVGGWKDFGSMNMDEFLKNVWTAEESQATAAPAAAASHGGDFGPGLQWQGSLTLPRTLSQKTVDEVWRGLDEFQHQPTLGEMTLEEFLVRAGVVRDDANQSESLINNNNISINTNNNSSRLFFSEPTASNNNNSSSLFFSEPTASNNSNAGIGTIELSSVIPYPAPLQLGGSVDLMSPQGMRGGGVMRIGDPTVNNESMTGMLSVSTASLPTNPISGDGYMKGNRELSPLSPIPYVFNEGMKVRKCGGAVEKVVERRQRRMIKNRESAARSRARKQAYTMELEAEIAKLKDQNQDLQIKQVESMKMQKDQILEIIDQQPGPKKRCLRRTKTGPW